MITDCSGLVALGISMIPSAVTGFAVPFCGVLWGVYGETQRPEFCSANADRGSVSSVREGIHKPTWPLRIGVLGIAT